MGNSESAAAPKVILSGECIEDRTDGDVCVDVCGKRCENVENSSPDCVEQEKDEQKRTKHSSTQKLIFAGERIEHRSDPESGGIRCDVAETLKFNIENSSCDCVEQERDEQKTEDSAAAALMKMGAESEKFSTPIESMPYAHFSGVEGATTSQENLPSRGADEFDIDFDQCFSQDTRKRLHWGNGFADPDEKKLKFLNYCHTNKIEENLSYKKCGNFFKAHIQGFRNAIQETHDIDDDPLGSPQGFQKQFNALMRKAQTVSNKNHCESTIAWVPLAIEIFECLPQKYARKLMPTHPDVQRSTATRTASTNDTLFEQFGAIPLSEFLEKSCGLSKESVGDIFQKNHFGDDSKAVDIIICLLPYVYNDDCIDDIQRVLQIGTIGDSTRIWRYIRGLVGREIVSERKV